MTQYLDNDEDGKVDNPLLIETLIKNHAALFIWKKMSQVNLNAQNLGADESRPEWHTNGHIGQFDATLEEVWRRFGMLLVIRGMPMPIPLFLVKKHPPN